jgi:hypothetical protein
LILRDEDCNIYTDQNKALPPVSSQHNYANASPPRAIIPLTSPHAQLSGQFCTIACTYCTQGHACFLSSLRSIGLPIILGRCPSLSAHYSESMLRIYLICKEKQEREREREISKRHVGEAHSLLTTVIILPQRQRCY